MDFNGFKNTTNEQKRSSFFLAMLHFINTHNTRANLDQLKNWLIWSKHSDQLVAALVLL
jgi:hypothetical protein